VTRIVSARGALLAGAAATASAVAFALCARVEWPWFLFVWVGLVPWLAALDRTTSLRGALAAGLCMCTAFVFVLFGWFAVAMQAYSGAPLVVTLLVLLLAAPLMEPQFITVALARAVLRRRTSSPWSVAVASACVYVGTEWAWPKLFADTLGQSLYGSSLLRQAADLGGTHGLTFVVVLGNECVLAMVQAATAAVSARDRIRAAAAPAFCAIALVLALLAYGAMRYEQFSGASTAERITAGVVQANISQYARLAAELGTFGAVRSILDTHFALSRSALARGGVDLLVWPETVYPTTFGAPKSADGAAFDREIAAFASATRTPLVFGAYDVEGNDEFNAAMFLAPTTDRHISFSAYRKASLFPLTERAPAVLDSEVVRRWLPWMGTWKPGSGRQVVPLTLPGGRTLRVAPLICYDTLDPTLAIAAVRQGAEVIVTLSNDSWFAFDGAQRLILILSAFRSIETRRPQLRAANTGISAVIAPTGELLETIAPDTRGTLVAAVTPESHARTLMLMWGDWFGPTALVCGGALLAAALLKR